MAGGWNDVLSLVPADRGGELMQSTTDVGHRQAGGPTLPPGHSAGAESVRLKPEVLAAPVLIVEDEAMIAWMLESLLEDMGFTAITVVATGDEALDAARRLSPGLIVSDINLGPSGLDGGRGGGRNQANFASARPVRHGLCGRRCAGSHPTGRPKLARAAQADQTRGIAPSHRGSGGTTIAELAPCVSSGTCGGVPRPRRYQSDKCQRRQEDERGQVAGVSIETRSGADWARSCPAGLGASRPFVDPQVAETCGP